MGRAPARARGVVRRVRERFIDFPRRGSASAAAGFAAAPFIASREPLGDKSS
jgi:hypothetical protein